MNNIPDFITQYTCAVTVCDINGIIVYMNEKSISNFSKWGGKELIGKSLFDCHNPTSNEKIRELLQTGNDNIYISKNSGKLIHQTAWRENDKICGLVELSFEMPKE
jgi:transcriptional regulator with PAS, ATPase and Fis domain